MKNFYKNKAGGIHVKQIICIRRICCCLLLLLALFANAVGTIDDDLTAIATTFRTGHIDIAVFEASVNSFIEKYDKPGDDHYSVGVAMHYLAMAYGDSRMPEKSLAIYRLMTRDFGDYPRMVAQANSSIEDICISNNNILSTEEKVAFEAQLRSSLVKDYSASNMGTATDRVMKLRIFLQGQNRLAETCVVGDKYIDWLISERERLSAIPNSDDAKMRIDGSLKYILSGRSAASFYFMLEYRGTKQDVPKENAALFFRLVQGCRWQNFDKSELPPLWVPTPDDKQATAEYLAGSAFKHLKSELARWEELRKKAPDAMSGTGNMQFFWDRFDESEALDEALNTKMKEQLDKQKWEEALATMRELAIRQAVQNHPEKSIAICDEYIHTFDGMIKPKDGIAMYDGKVMPLVQLISYLQQFYGRAIKERSYYSMCLQREYLASKPVMDGEKEKMFARIAEAWKVVPKPGNPIIPIWTKTPDDPQATQVYLTGLLYDIIVADKDGIATYDGKVMQLVQVISYLQQFYGRAIIECAIYSMCLQHEYLASKPVLDGEKEKMFARIAEALKVVPEPDYPIITIWTKTSDDAKATQEYLGGPIYDLIVADITRWRQLRTDMPARVPDYIVKYLDKLDELGKKDVQKKEIPATDAPAK